MTALKTEATLLVDDSQIDIKTLEDFEKLRESLIKDKKTEPEFMSQLGVFEGLLEITQPVDTEPYVLLHSQHFNEIYVSKQIFRKLKDKLIRIDFEEEISHGHYSARNGSMVYVENVNDSRKTQDYTYLGFTLGSNNLTINVNDVNEAILLLRTYNRAKETNSYKTRIT